MATSKNIGGIAVYLRAEVGPFLRNLKKAQGGFSRFANKAKNAAGSIVKIGAVAVTAAGVGLTVFAKKQADAIRQTTLMADRLGITTSALTELQFAASQYGVDSDKLHDSMKDLSERIADAASGASGYEEALNRLGLRSQDLIKLPLEQQFMAVSQGVAGLSTQADKAFVSMELMGDAGFELINMMDGGAASIAGMRREAQDLGLSLNRVDAEKVRQAGAAFDKAWKVVEGLGKQLAIGVAPYVTLVTERTIEWAKKMGGVGGIGKKVFNLLLDGVEFVIDAGQRLGVVWQSLRAGSAKMAEWNGRAMRAIAESAIWVKTKVVQAWDVVSAGFKVAWKGIEYLNVQVVGSIIKGFSRMVSQFGESLRQMGDKAAASGIPGITAFGEKAQAAGQGLIDASARISGGTNRAIAQSAAGLQQAAEEASAAKRALQSQVDTRVPGMDALVNQLSKTSAEEFDKFLQLKYAEKKSTQVRFEIEQLLADLNKRAVEAANKANAVAGQGGQTTPAEDPQVVAARQRYQMLEQLAQQHQGTLTGVWYEGLKQREEFNAMSMRAQVKDVVGNLVQMTSGLAKHNKAMFFINKAAGITQAVMNAQEAFTLNLAKYPGPLGITMGGIALAAGLARAASIASQSYGSKSTGGAARTPPPAPTQQQQQPRQQLILPESGFIRSDSLIDLLNDAKEQGLQISGARYA